MRFKGLDLNLLVVLDALMTQRNLTAAARSINLSQPAMSAALARLRAYFRDELFTMSGRKLVATPRAEGLAAPVREALVHIQRSIISRDAFNPARSTRRFKIILSDFTTIVFFRKIMDRIARDAPDVSFELLPLVDDPDGLLRRGEVDFLILPEVLLSNAHPKATLFEETLVCVGCRSNKQLPARLTFERYASMGHVAVKFGRTRKLLGDKWLLLDPPLKRRIEVVVQSFSLIPPMLLHTGRIATMPLRLVKHFEETMPLQIVELPLPLPVFTEAVQWPAFHNSDPESIWMREVLLREAFQMAPPHKRTGRSTRLQFAQSVSSPTLRNNPDLDA
ncbi:LysR family transcriptional regulator [Bradyrhizobium sp. BWA-3-5]|uniref:LysR family transcriptional regulator n=1 Tax=Bradyrhizobium sp. BWA-3-5 TaxID=3080013 RepID=UPI00293F298A|nr:LysR family transcriptional regulator [Bradyrhizobium sp. BWA-3-5]WOH63837.1 LysR family transcriptional regulator [Bradyrhizobium sp. BWA-3-5]